MAVISAASGIPMAAEPELKTVGKQELDRTDFLTMFITQLQYQDPMKPMDSYEMASQLAQFSNMEATMKMSDNMEKLLDYQTSQNNLELLSLLDKEVQGNGNMMGVNNGETTWTEFMLTEAAETC
ncbi:MAG: flagellar hook assembly protein FlgD, partial [Desulfobulbaceae bacterium]|nr:flagellar hook assembly protein FlgD [Desulfobulbaceae bacterium]